MPRYNHAVTLAFEVISNQKDGEDITADILRAALQKRMEDLDSEGDLVWLQACMTPFDTYEMED